MFFKRNISKLSDEELLTHYTKSGDTEYFGELYNRYIPLLYGLCLKYLQDEDRAQEAVMQLFEDLLPKTGNYEIKVFKPWLYRVAKNHCLQLLRKENKEIPLDYTINVMESDEFLHLLSEEESPEEQLKALHHCLEKLPEEQRTSITRFFLEEMSYADIVEQTGFTLNNVKSYIQNGLRKGKEAHRLEKESMKDPFLADAMDGYGQVEGNHEQRIGQLRMQVSARATKKRNLSKKQNSYAVTWSIAACLVIGIGISCYFLFLKKRMTDDVFIAKEEIPSAVFEPISPKEEISSLAETKIKQDSTHEVTATPTDKKDIVAKSKSIPKTQSAPVAITPVIEETVGRTDIQEERIVADTDTSLSEVHQLKVAKAATPNLNLIKGKVTDEKGEPIIGASVAYTGTNIGTVTDLNGEFILKKEKGNKQLTAQFIGYEPVEIPVDTSRTMLIAMNEDQQALSEVVVVGYGKKKKSNVAGATAKINLKAKEKYKTPQPVIGKRKYKKYLEENLIRPNDESCKDVKGEVVLSFFVDKEGRPQNITVVHGLCESADKEAIRLVKEGPKWTSGDLPTRVTVEF